MVAEQQADCFVGVYMRAVAENTSPRLTLSTSQWVEQVDSRHAPVRRPSLAGSGEGEHGSAFERVSAFQFGFTDGMSACLAIDADEIARRRGDLPINLQEKEVGEVPIAEDLVKAMVDTLNMFHQLSNPPTLSFENQACPEARSTPPVSYCPATNTISVDIAGLSAIGTPSTGLGRPIIGDNTAFSVLTSRYMLAIEHEDGLALDTPAAALRTACLTGLATAKMSHETELSSGYTVALAPGDLDEVLSGLLTNGLVAADVNGESVPSGFSRIEAFRTGVLGEQESCTRRYP